MSVQAECPFCRHAFAVPELSPNTHLDCPQCRRPFPAALAVPASVPGDQPRPGILVAAEGPSREPRARAKPRGLTTLVTDIVSKVVGKVPATTPKPPGAELTVIALTLGMIALAIGWPLQQGLLALGLSGLGLILAGTIVAPLAWRKAPGLALPTTALLINLQGLILAVVFCATDHGQEGPGDSYRPLTSLHAGLASSDPAVKAEAIADFRKLLKNIGGALGELLPALRDADAEVRAAAAEALGHMGAHARIAYPALDQLSRTDPHDSVRRSSRDAIFEIGRPSPADKTDLSRWLDSRHPVLRAAAAQALGAVGTEAWDRSDQLVKALADPDPEVKVSAAQALWLVQRKQGEEVVSILVSGLDNRENSPAVRRLAAAALGGMGHLPPKAVDALAKALELGAPALRIQAAFALGSLKRDETSKRALPSLRAALKDNETLVKLVAAHALWKLDGKTDGMPILVDLFVNQRQDTDVRVTAANALGSFGSKGKEAVPALAGCLRDPSAEVRSEAARALHRIGKDAVAAVDQLVDALVHGDPVTRAEAAIALDGIGPEAKAAIPMLRHVMRDDADLNPQLFAARALWAIERKDMDGEIMLKLRDLAVDKSNRDLRKYAVGGLALMGEKAGPAVPFLHLLFKEADAELRLAAVEAIGEIGGPFARVVYPTLEKLADDEQIEAPLRSAAREAAKKLGLPTRADLAVLRQALDPKYPEGFRVNAALSLMFLKRQAKEAVDALSARLADREPGVCVAAAFALESLGPDAAPAVADLRKALFHADKTVCAQAARTLGSIGPKAKIAVPDLQKLIVDPDRPLDVRLHAAEALRLLGDDPRGLVPVLTGGLEAKDVSLAVQAAQTLAKIGAAGDAAQYVLRDAAVPKLRAALWPKKASEDDDETEEPEARDALRREAVVTLGALGYAARDALPDLVRALDPEPEFLITVAQAISKIAAAEATKSKSDIRAKAAYSSLEYFAKAPDEDVQTAIAAALDTIGQPAPADARILLDILRNKEKQPVSESLLLFRIRASQVIGLIEWKDEDVPALLDCIRGLADIVRNDRHPKIRSAASEALAGTLTVLKEDARAREESALAALQDVLAGSEAEVQIAAARALGQIFAGVVAPPTVRERLQTAASSSDSNLAAAAQAALKKIKPM